ncbi:ABC-three component system protein [Streptomyces sp. DT190]|uniref:ABC-three component system protein n=1 Tax=unclassified Streptomyces TaxID=2593676 RepID=UPI003CEC28D6
MAEREPDFEASASALGYVYQLREALHLCVSRLGGLDWALAIEAGDDIEEVRQGGRTYYQLKHRAPGTRMTNASVDLWKTLRIWAHAIDRGQLDLEHTDLILLTTAELSAGSVGSMLQPAESRQRDERNALEALKATRRTSKNDALAKAFEAFDLLSPQQLERMVARIRVIGNAPDVDAVEQKLRQAAIMAVGREHATAFLVRLEGWFFRRTIQQLRSGSLDAITGLDFDAVFSDLRNQFGRANLPIDEDIAEMEADLARYAGQTFVRQLELIELGSRRVNRAVRDYMRAVSQRSRWLNENLLLPKELSRYERRLIEEWEELFDDMVDTLGAEAAAAEKIAAATSIYRWAMTEAQQRIRPECDEPFVAKGSFHILADDCRIGWHMDFVARLMAVLEPVETTSA